MIWNKKPTIEGINKRGQNTLVSYLDIHIDEVGDDFLAGTMPVDHKTHQPLGILHGGASAAFAESLASIAGNCVVDTDHYCVGLEINCNHLRSVNTGRVKGVATPHHLGRKTQVWEIKITQNEKPVCISRMTLMVLEKK